MGGTLYVVALLPIVFYIALFTLIVVLVVKALKRNSKRANEGDYQKIATESVQFQRDSILQQQLIANEIEEVKSRLVSIERILKEVE